MPKGEYILTFIINKSPEGGFIGFIEEIPGINTQGETQEEVKRNLEDALNLVKEITDNNKKIGFLDYNKIYQLSLLANSGINVFGNKPEFFKWLIANNFYLDNKKPVEYLETISGIQFILERMEGMKIGDNV